ncbi:MAG: response regulator [Verrucomicrobiota bacterium JB022]|nr:response regulator [Verrucomicrobiota bacterium JB022]
MKIAEPPQSILVVDDTPENITVLRQLLSREGYRVRPALRGKLAIEAAQIEPPDLVVLDIMMPEMDGFAVCQALKADARTRDIPVLFLSALDGIEDKLRGFQLGGIDYIPKPFQAEEVLARVDTHLRLRRAQEQLRRQNEELQQAAVLQADVERILRHDLKSPLGNIINFAELLLDDRGLSGDQRLSIETMREAAFRMLGMVNTSFDLLKMERGAYEYHPTAFDLLPVLQRLRAELRLSADQKYLRWECEVEGQPLALLAGQPLAVACWIQGEELLCHSLFANLLKNAVEAAPVGSVLRWQIRSVEGMLEVKLRNAGEVPAEIRERFFDKYATAGKPSGTGLGTYSAQLMTRTQGGEIALNTSEEGYTTVVVRLPLVLPPVEFRPEELMLEAEEDEAPEHLSVLLVDDDPAVHSFIRQQLSVDGWSVTSVYDGPTGLQQLQKRGYTAVLLDNQMPGWDGPSTALQIRNWERESPERQPCTIVVFSAEIDAELKTRARAMGIQELLQKPISGPALRTTLRRLVQSHRAGRETGLPFAPTVDVDEDLQDVLPAALESWRDLVRQLRPLAESGQAVPLRSYAHRLKGGLALYGLDTASEIATRIDLGCLHSPQKLPNRVLTDIDRLQHYLDEVHVRFVTLD